MSGDAPGGVSYDGALDRRLGRCRRLRHSDEFRKVFDSGRSIHGRDLVVYWLKTPDNPGSRLGVSIGKKHGNAVVRARIKRRLREIFRQTRHELAFSCDVILIARVRKREPAFDALLDEFRSLIRRINMSGESSRRQG